MKTTLKIKFLLLTVLFITACSSDDDSNSSFLSYGIMKADFDGKEINLNVDKAKEFPGTSGYLTILGRNCSEGKVVVRFDVPINQTGDFTLSELGFTSYSINSASACPGESGGSTPLLNDEVNVRVTELTNTNIKGTFNINARYGVEPRLVENGVFDVEIE